MVSAGWLVHATRAAFLGASQVIQGAGKAAYRSNAAAAIETLQGWYNPGKGLWDSTGWWNSANCLTVLADFATVEDGGFAHSLDIAGIISNTFSNAQKLAVTVQKSISPSGLVQSRYTMASAEDSPAVDGFPCFINDYYDDEGWWGLALVRSWDLVQEPKYLDMAQYIFEDMKNGTDKVCGGGIWWDRSQTYKNAIANELYLSLAASLANRVPNQKDYYLDIAKQEWDWFKASGMINENNNINDGLTIENDGSCTNNGLNAWSYNQGVILGGLVELDKATGSHSYYGHGSPTGNSSYRGADTGASPYLSEAETLAMAAISLLSDSNGIIHDVGCEPNCGGDADQFKGIFMRNLGYLHAAAPQDAYRASMLRNADSIWANDRDVRNNQLGVVWSGPYDAGDGPTAGTHSSATDALVAAIVASK